MDVALKIQEGRKQGISDTAMVNSLMKVDDRFAKGREQGLSDTALLNSYLKSASKVDISKQNFNAGDNNNITIDTQDLQNPQGVDNTATEPTSLDFAQSGLWTLNKVQQRFNNIGRISQEQPKGSIDNPVYTSEQEKQNYISEHHPDAEFPTYYIDPRTGQTIEVQPTGLEDESLMVLPIGRLSPIAMPKGLVEYLTPKGIASLSKEAQLAISRNPEKFTKEDLDYIMSVPKEDQMMAVANMGGSDTLGLIKNAVVDKATDRIALSKELNARRQALLDSVGPIDVDAAKAKYADMIEEISKNNHVAMDGRPILEDINFLEKFYGTTPSKANQIVSRAKAILEDNPNMTLNDALEFRADLNYLISRASRGKEKIKLGDIKNKLDKFIGSVATPAQKAKIDDAIYTYSRTMQNRDLNEAIQKATKDNRAVDWDKLSKILEDEHLNTPEAQTALNIAKDFANKFKNDGKLLEASTVKGSNPNAGGVLGFWGFVVNQLKDHLALWGNRAQNLKLQNAIQKTLRNSKTRLDFIENLKANKDIPDFVYKAFENAPKAIEYKPGVPTSAEINGEVKPLYATPKGTISDNATEAALHDAQVQLVKDSLGKDYTPEVSKQLGELFIKGNKRIDKVAKAVGDRMKADNIAGNMKMLRNMMKNEADNLIKNIQRETGLKLPKEEADKIIKMKMDKLMKECG